MQGGNGALSPAAKEAIAAELDGLKGDLLCVANTSFLGRTAGNPSVFSLFDTVVGNLRDGTPVSDQLTAIDARLATIIGQRSEVGARQARLERAQGGLLEQSGALEAQRSRVEDIDLAKVILDLKLQEVTYQSALAVTARVLQPTLMDFLR
ncbi:hypothetical protein E3T53_08925 [Cryobacterium psychrophilum]|uniref:Flagellin C-terminal domain-containing protein n=2 Tax=Cryobacterium psychrophilum TaxID=41988 RepID=A0A4Y8KQ00_9MICO|nr:hypothetical protein E3T53_08925 [Cryobacterium psychrophilum]